MHLRYCCAFLAVSLPGWAGCRSDPESVASGPASTTQPARSVVVKEASLASIRVAPVTERSIPVSLTTHGKVQFNEERTAVILAPLAGQVLNLNVRVGDTVKQGDVLFVINSRELAASIDEYLEARKDLQLADKTYTMTKDLFSHQAASNIQLQQADNDLAKAKTKVVRVSQQLRVLDVNGDGILDETELNPRVPIKSPLSGKVIERHVTERQYVQGDNTSLLTIADLSTVWVLAEVFERDLRLIKVGQRAEVTTLAYPDHVCTASVQQIGDTVDPVTRAVKVRLVVGNTECQLKPEMFATVRFFLSDSERAVTLPPKAVFSESGEHFVFISVGQREFAGHKVEVSPLPDGDLRVIRGLQAGQQVVTDGVLLLNAERKRQSTGDLD